MRILFRYDDEDTLAVVNNIQFLQTKMSFYLDGLIYTVKLEKLTMDVVKNNLLKTGYADITLYKVDCDY